MFYASIKSAVKLQNSGALFLVMNNLLKHLTEEELSRFEKFINSPYFNTSAKICELYTHIKVSADQPPDKQKIFSLLYPGEKYNDARLRKLLSELKKLYDKFLGYTGIEKLDPFSINTSMLELMLAKGMADEFSAAYRQVTRGLTSDFFKEDPYYRSLSRLESLKYYAGYDKLKKPSPKGLEKSSFNMDMQFVYTKLHLTRDIMLHNILNEEKYPAKIEFYDEIIKFVKENLNIIIKEHPNLYIIYLTVMATADESNSDYISSLASYIRTNEKKFDRGRLSYYYTYLTSYYWTKLNKGDMSYCSALMDIYRNMERKGIIKSERYITHSVFNSVVIAAVWVNDYRWLEKFIHNHKDDIEPAYHNDVYNLSLAKLYFYTGKYELSLKHLSNVEYKTPSYYINAKSILLKTLYQMGDFESIKYTLDSLKHYSYRNKSLVSLQAQNIKMTIKYFKYLLKVRNKDKLARHKFLEMLEREKTFVPERNWLIEKIEELGQIHND